MSRPKKAIVDYFAHTCKHGRVIFVMETNWGNDGYALFYKLYELLGDSEGHVFDLRKPGNRDYMQAYTRLDGDAVDIMLAKLAELGVIDKDLLHDDLIWSEPFVQDLEEVYRRRKIARPERPRGRNNCEDMSGTTGLPSPESSESEGPLNRNRQSIVHKSKPNKKILPSPLSPGVTSESSQSEKCPHKAIIALYHQKLPSLPPVQDWTEQRESLLRSRWKENEDRQSLAWWASFFDKVGQSDFLMGLSGSTFAANLEWLLQRKNFTKVIEGAYDKKASARAKEKWELALEGTL